MPLLRGPERSRLRAAAVKRGALLALVVAGCGGALDRPPCQDGRCGTQVSWQEQYQRNIDRELDMLFVVDDTPAIASHAGALPAGFAGIAGVVTGSPLPISLHVGFIRSGGCDASTRGGACGITAPEQFLRAEWCQTITNAALPIAESFACLGDMGAADCGPAQPLAAAVQALTAPRAGWDGFLRPAAYLAIVVVAAQDDASGPAGSPTAVADLVAAIRTIKGDPSQILVSVIGSKDCGTAAVPTPRLLDFVNAFGANGLYTSLCDATFTPAVDRVVADTGTAIDPPCTTNVRDTDPQTAGLQADCTVRSVSRNPDGSQTTSQLTGCDVGAPPCWRFVAGGLCGNGQGCVFEVDHPPDWCYEAGESLSIECLACADPADPACKSTQAR